MREHHPKNPTTKGTKMNLNDTQKFEDWNGKNYDLTVDQQTILLRLLREGNEAILLDAILFPVYSELYSMGLIVLVNPMIDLNTRTDTFTRSAELAMSGDPNSPQTLTIGAQLRDQLFAARHQRQVMEDTYWNQQVTVWRRSADNLRRGSRMIEECLEVDFRQRSDAKALRSLTT